MHQPSPGLLFLVSMCGQVLTEVEVHLDPQDGVEDEVWRVDPELGLEHVVDEVEVLLAGDDDVVDVGGAGVHLPDLLGRLSVPVLYPATPGVEEGQEGRGNGTGG